MSQRREGRTSQRREGGDGGGLARRSFSADDLRVSTAQVMSGSVQIRAAADSRRVMGVQFVGTVGGLGIKLLQLINGHVQEFELARLSYRNLAVCWAWERNDMFVIAAVEDATSFRLFHEIYCWPQDISRNDWLAFFESKSVRTMTVHEAAMQDGRDLRQRRDSLSALPPIPETQPLMTLSMSSCTDTEAPGAPGAPERHSVPASGAMRSSPRTVLPERTRSSLEALCRSVS